MKICAAIAGVSLMLAIPVFAAAPKATAPAADVATLTSEIQTAIATVKSQFTPGESDADKETALQAAINAAISSSGFDAVTAQAALQLLANNSSLEGQAVSAVLALVTPAAQQEAAQAGSTGGSAGGSIGGGFAGSAGGGGGGGGYVTSR